MSSLLQDLNKRWCHGNAENFTNGVSLQSTFIHTLTLQNYEMCQLGDELVTVFIDKLEAAVIICILNVLYE